MLVNLQAWVPQTWHQIIGNQQLKQFLRSLVTKLRKEYERTGIIPAEARQAFLLMGASRSGKTALVKFFVRCLTCRALDADLNPCRHTCNACRWLPELTGQEGLFSAVVANEGQLAVELTVIDCTKILSPADLKDKLQDIPVWDKELRVMYFDEVHHLVRRSMDEILLKPIEDYPHMWVFSTAMPGELDQMFKNRVHKFRTTPPDSSEMASWTCDRCDEFGIYWTPEAIERLVEKSNRTPGIALQALALAAIYPEGLTLELVDNVWSLQGE